MPPTVSPAVPPGLATACLYIYIYLLRRLVLVVLFFLRLIRLARRRLTILRRRPSLLPLRWCRRRRPGSRLASRRRRGLVLRLRWTIHLRTWLIRLGSIRLGSIRLGSIRLCRRRTIIAGRRLEWTALRTIVRRRLVRLRAISRIRLIRLRPVWLWLVRLRTIIRGRLTRLRRGWTVRSGLVR